MRTWLPAVLTALGLSFAASAWSADDVGKKMLDPVSGKEVVVAKETPYVIVYPNRVYFADGKNREAFIKAPEMYLKQADCPIKGLKFRPEKANRLVVNDQILYFCCANCPQEFMKDPGLTGMVKDPVSGNEFSPAADSPKSTYKGSLYYFEDEARKTAFEKEPAKYAKVVIP